MQRGTLGAILLICAVGLAMRWLFIGDRPLSGDEAYSVAWAGRSLQSVLTVELWRDNSPPLYYVLLNLWMGLGTSEATLRLLSLALGAATIPIVIAHGRTLVDTRTGLIAGALLALSPIAIRYAQEVRMYAVYGLGAALALWALTEAIQPHTTSRLGWWAAAVGGTCIVIFSHSIGMTFWGAILCWGAAMTLWRRFPVQCPAPPHFPARAFWWTQAVILLAYSPYGLFVAAQQVTRVTEGFWARPPTVLSVLAIFGRLGMAWQPDYIPWLLAIGFFLMAFGAAGVWHLRHRPREVTLLAAVVILPLAGLLLYSLRRSLLIDRVLLFYTPILLLLVATGIRTSAISWQESQTTRAWLPAMPMSLFTGIGVIVIITGSLAGRIGYQERLVDNDWAGAGRYLATHATEDDLLVIFPPFAVTALHYYLDAAGGFKQTTNFQLVRPTLAPPAVADDTYAGLYAPQRTPHELAAGPAQTIWLLRYPEADVQVMLDMQSLIASELTYIESLPFGETLVLDRFVRP